MSYNLNKQQKTTIDGTLLIYKYRVLHERLKKFKKKLSRNIFGQLISSDSMTVHLLVSN